MQLQWDNFNDNEVLFSCSLFKPFITTFGEKEMLVTVISDPIHTSFNMLVVFDLDNQTANTLNVKDACDIAQYKDGKIIVEEKSTSKLLEVDLLSGGVEQFYVATSELVDSLFGLAYDRDHDKITFVMEQRVSQITPQGLQGTNKIIPYSYRENGDFSNYACFLQGKYVLIRSQYIFSYTLSVSESNKALRFANASMDETIASFCEANREVEVEFSSRGIWRAEDIMNILLTKDSDVDIIQLYAGSGLTRIMGKGYFVDLSHSKIVSGKIASMYPQIINAITYDGRIAAIPTDMTVSIWRIDEAVLKKDAIAYMGDWANVVKDAAASFDVVDSTYSIFPSGTNKNLLLYDILVQYIVENEMADSFKFSTPELRSIIEVILELPEAVFMKDNLEAGMSNAYDEGMPPMFSLMESFSINRYKRFYEHYNPQPEAPPRFFSSNHPVIRGTLSVYMINPFSKNQDAAIAFLEHAAQNMQPEICFMMQEEYDEPIANLRMVDFEKDVNRTISTLEEKLKMIDETESAVIKDAIQTEEVNLQYIHNNDWLLSREDIEAYREMSQYISFMPNSLCFTDSTYSQTTINL